MKRKNKAATALFCVCLIFTVISQTHAFALAEIGSDAFFEERDLIARAVELTAPDASYAARLAIAAVIVNRAKDARFPSEIRSVIYEVGVFDCVSDPNFEKVTPTYLSRAAARDALLGFDVTAGALYYKKGSVADSDGACFRHSGFLFFKKRPDTQ